MAAAGASGMGSAVCRNMGEILGMFVRGCRCSRGKGTCCGVGERGGSCKGDIFGV